MKIEDYWVDGELYSVCFETTGHRKIQKMIILPADEPLNVEEIVRNRFNAVNNVLRIEIIDSCLVLKGA